MAGTSKQVKMCVAGRIVTSVVVEIGCLGGGRGGGWAVGGSDGRWQRAWLQCARAAVSALVLL